MIADLRCYLVLDAALCGPLGMAETARRAVRGGAVAVQLRMKEATTAERVEAGAEVRRAIGGDALFIVNDDVEAALELDADGVHVGQQDMSPAEVRARIGRRMLLGLSVETEAQARAVDRTLIDHIGAGPVRATTTKPGHAAPTGWKGIARIVAAVGPVPAVAIGGVGASDAADAVRAGVGGLAVVSAICGQPDPERAARQIRDAMTRELEALT